LAAQDKFIDDIETYVAAAAKFNAAGDVFNAAVTDELNRIADAYDSAFLEPVEIPTRPCLGVNDPYDNDFIYNF